MKTKKKIQMLKNLGDAGLYTVQKKCLVIIYAFISSLRF